jgi:hypothetical protein
MYLFRQRWISIVSRPYKNNNFSLIFEIKTVRFFYHQFITIDVESIWNNIDILSPVEMSRTPFGIVGPTMLDSVGWTFN